MPTDEHNLPENQPLVKEKIMSSNEQNRPFRLSGLKRPDVITSKTKQRAIFVRDASVSMDDDDKARDASTATQNFLAELARPENKDGFYLAVIDFAEIAEVSVPFARATELEGSLHEISTSYCTNITAGLAKAREILDEADDRLDSSERFLKPVVILFTDGGHNTGCQPYKEAEQLKQIADIVCVAFGSDADLDLLRQIANSPEHCYRCRDGHDLRAFMAAVGSTLSESIRAGIDATQPLAEINK